MKKRQGMAYRHMMAGVRFHGAETISALTIGQARGQLREIKKDFENLKRRVERKTESRVDYFATYVHDYIEEAGGWRRHAHILWTAQETDFRVLLPLWMEVTRGRDKSLYIDNKVAKTPWKLGYAIQYAASKQGESVRYAYSRGWLPIGYTEEWAKVREEHRAMNIPLNETICELNSWIDRQKVIHQDRSKQTLLRTTDASNATSQLLPAGDGDHDCLTAGGSTHATMGATGGACGLNCDNGPYKRNYPFIKR
jgi:hypothetical protein